MIVWRDLETGPVYPSIGSAPSIGTLGMSLSVTTFMKSLLVLDQIQGIRMPQLRRRSFAARPWRQPSGAGGAAVKWSGMEGAGYLTAPNRTFRPVRTPS